MKEADMIHFVAHFIYFYWELREGKTENNSF